MSNLMHECDCGQRYATLAGIESCQINNHGQPRRDSAIFAVRRIETLSQLAMHLFSCLTCQDEAGFGHSKRPTRCPNGRRLWNAAGLGDCPTPMPREWGPCDADDTVVGHKPGKFIDAKESH